MGLLHIQGDHHWRMHMMTKHDDAQAVIAVQGGAWRMVEHLNGVVCSGWRFHPELPPAPAD